MVKGVARGLWPTPKSEPSGPDYARANREGSCGDDLATAVARLLPTPSARDWKSGKASPETMAKNAMPLNEMIETTSAGGSLNPTFVEYLMGYPLGWTVCEAWETRSSRRSRRK
jgi:hypothetical protein